MIIVFTSFSKSSVFKMFSVHTKTKELAFPSSSCLKSVSEKLRFREGLVWTACHFSEVSYNFDSKVSYTNFSAPKK